MVIREIVWAIASYRGVILDVVSLNESVIHTAVMTVACTAPPSAPPLLVSDFHHSIEGVTMPALLLAYFVSALCYSILCGMLGKSYHPAVAYMVYALALTPGLGVALIVGRFTQLWQWRRLWPPNRDETRAAIASTIILTASTLMFLSPQSLIAVFLSQAGCLLLVARFSSPSSMVLAGISMVAVGLSIVHKPILVAALPIGLGMVKMLGYAIKIGSVNSSKSPSGSGGPTARANPDDFLAAEQVLISVLALAVAGVFGVASLQLGVTTHGAFLLDWRLWAMSASSLGMGLLGTRILQRGSRETTSFTFPAYRMMSLLAALGAAWTRGELRFQAEHWANWTAALLACITIVLASRSAAASSLVVAPTSNQLSVPKLPQAV